jgi:hypothetical protein
LITVGTREPVGRAAKLIDVTVDTADVNVKPFALAGSTNVFADEDPPCGVYVAGSAVTLADPAKVSVEVVASVEPEPSPA